MAQEEIKITPEILVNNGFKELGFPGWELVGKTEDGNDLLWHILWRNDYPNVLTIEGYNSDFGSFSKFNIDYVSQLQAAINLCGIKKEIVA